jgi:histidine triad (HIT) family protein
MEDCIFCKIANGQISSAKVFENENLVAFNDIEPKAKVHVLVVPKKHIESIKHFEENDGGLLTEMVLTAKKIAEDNNLAGYKLVINVGKEGGQTINHLHLHLLSGDASSELKV